MTETDQVPPRTDSVERHKQFVEYIRSLPPGTFSGCPGWFRGRCWEASKGGPVGYEAAGESLGGAVFELEPYDTDAEEWAELIARELLPSAEAGDAAAVVAWLVRRFPKFMQRVPARLRAAFAGGFIPAFLDAAAERGLR